MVCDPNQNVNPINIRILTGFFCCLFSHHYGSVVKNLPANEEDTVLIPGLGRSPGGGNGNSLQYSSLGNFTKRETWQATV